MQGIDREAAGKVLLNAGYTVDNGGSVMMILVGEDKRKKVSEEHKAVEKLLRGAGYLSSFGVKVGDKGGV